jgi:hypothetical protein
MYPNDHDKFARLKAIASGQNPETAATQDIKFWSFEKDGNILGTITEFNSFVHPQYGEQHTVIVRLADSNELVSAFLTGWLQEGMRRQRAEVGDLILIQFLGKHPGERFNRFHLEIEKPNTAF